MLPKTQYPLFDIAIPSLKRKVKFRPYLAREEKILLMALEGQDESSEDRELIDAVKQIINNCCQDESVDIRNLAIFDLDYIYIKLRARSVNNIAEVAYRDLEDEKTYKFEIDLDKIEMTEDPEHTNLIDVDGNIKIKLKYPTLAVAEQMSRAKTEAEVFDVMFYNCVDKIYDKETVYEEYTEEELKAFLDELDIKTFDQIKKFFGTLPQLKYDITYTNEKGTVRVVEHTTLRDFFQF